MIVGMAESNGFARITNLVERLQDVRTAWLDWYKAEPPFEISVENLQVATNMAALCGMAHGPVNPNPFGSRPPRTTADPNDQLTVLRERAIESIASAKEAIAGVKPFIADALGSDWTTLLRQWLAELEAHGLDAPRAFPPNEHAGTRCAYIIQQIAQMTTDLENADCTPIDGPSTEEDLRDGVECEWSTLMPKSKMASRLRLSPKQFETFAKSHELRRHNRQLWQIRLDKLDPRTRQRLEGPESAQ